MIEIFEFITSSLGRVGFWLREDLKRTIEDRVAAIIGSYPELEIENGHARHYLPDSQEVRFLMRAAIIEGLTKTGQVEPRWNSYDAKLKIIAPLKISRQERLALQKACEAQARPYRQRAMEWLASTEDITDPLLRSFKAQLIQWDENLRAGKKTYKLPLSEKQLVVLCDHVFRTHPDWIAPPEEELEEFVEIKRFDVWTGETSIEKVPKRKVEIEARRRDYYERTMASKV
jgi:hypothetical protein